MIELVKEIVDMNTKAKQVLRAVYENPYTEMNKLQGLVNLEINELNESLELLTEKQIVIELTSPSSSNIESRVPKKVFLVNPEIEENLEEFF